MADLKTTVTELVTGLGMLGYDSVDRALEARPAEMTSVSPEVWNELAAAHEGGALRREFDAAFANGASFLSASDGLRGRRPLTIEGKGAQKNPGDEVLPIDLRVDHVYLISCKYLSKILHNASPSRVFDHSLRHVRTDGHLDWFDHMAPHLHGALYNACIDVCGLEDLPMSPLSLSAPERRRLRDAFPAKWPQEIDSLYAQMCAVVSEKSAERWSRSLQAKSEQEATLWRVLRLGQAPYFVLGSSPVGSLRLRVATPWDWRQRFELKRFMVEPKPGGQPMVSWTAIVRSRRTGVDQEVNGHVEIRWSHGRFGGRPEAKVYLDTPHVDVPGYFPLI